MPADSSLISVTAKVSAYYRQFSDIQFAQEASELIGARAAFEKILSEHALKSENLTFYAPMFEARYKSITELIRKFDSSQVIELASGYSLRGLDLTRGGDIRYVETDLPGVIHTKLGLLEEIRRHHAIPPNAQHVVTAANALVFEEVQASAASLDPAQRLTVLCEGLIMYLSKAQTEVLARNIRRLLGGFASGCWITPDFTFRSEAANLSPDRVRLREAITGVTQTQLDASAFDDEQDLIAFLGRLGLRVQVFSQVDETPSFSSLKALGLPPTVIERLRGVLRVWVMTIDS
ncbi:MAG: class I SAM-dependent methyltransferase [Ralstonia sp.]|uniref:class I SAM-dependent methyltransferase n=1 Tax=Ralstonia sp. TaxID=54061 RepID=UPI003F7DE55F